MVKIRETPVFIKPSEIQANPVVIRGHTLLCLQGFRGEGYSPDFIDNMMAIHTLLQSHPDTRVRVTDSPDHFCVACPNLKENEPPALAGQGKNQAYKKAGCTLRGPDFERHIVFQDRQVLELLGLRAGQEVAWAEVLQRIGSRVRGEMLSGICGDCQWLSLGYCKEGIEKLQAFTRSSPIT
jgi:hypothetical protein